jgi:hypothetical protein
MKMKNYLTEWKKYKQNILIETKTLDQIAADKAKLAAEEAAALKKAAEDKKKQQQEEAKELKKQQIKTGTSSPKPTTGLTTEADNMSVGGLADGAVGNVPYQILDEEELTEEQLEEASGCHEGMEEGGKSCMVELSYDEMEEEKTCNECKYCKTDKLLTEAKYKGRTVPLGKPMRGDVKKFKVFVRDPKTGNVKKVNFGDKKMRIKKSNPKRRKSFRARHNCANPGPRTKARYWSCRKW